MPTEQQKVRFLKSVYFGVSDNPVDDVNPFQNIEEFSVALVGEMRWGVDSGVRERSKLRFAFNYNAVLKQFQIELPIEDIFSNLRDDLSNGDVVNIWVQLANFNN